MVSKISTFQLRTALIFLLLIQLGIGVYLSIASLRSQWNTEAKVVSNSLSCPPYQASNWTNMRFTLAQGPSPRSAVQNSPGGTRQGAVD